MRMILRITKSLLLLAAFATFSFAAAPVASVIGNAPIDVGGIRTPARTLVPVAVGDEVSTEAGPAVVEFRDGSKVVLQPESQLQIEGEPSDPSIRMVRGSAIYDLAPTSKIRVTNSKGETVNQILDTTLPIDGPVINRGTGPNPEVVFYRNSGSRQTGFATPDSPFMVGSFDLSASSGAEAAGPATSRIATPSGTTINLTAVTVNGVTTFQVTSIQQIVTQPNGQTAIVTITSGSLIGATIPTVTSSTQAGSQVTIQFLAPGSNTPLPTQQAAAQLNAAINQAITTAVQNGTLQPGTQGFTPKPTTTGQFTTISASAP